MYAFLCARVPQGDARKDALDPMIKHDIPFILSVKSEDVVSFVKKDPEEDGRKIAHPVNSNDQPISTDKLIRPSFTPVGNSNTSEFGYNQAQVSSVTNALEMSQVSSFSFRPQTGNTIIQNAFLSLSGPSIFDREPQEAPIFTTPTNAFRSDNVVQDTLPLPIHPVQDSNDPDDSAVPEPVVREEFEQSNAAKQSLPTASTGSSVFKHSQHQKPNSTASNDPFRSGNAAVESTFQQSDYEMDPIDLFSPETVVKEESEHSPPVNQVLSSFSSSSAPVDQDEPNDIFQDIKPQHIDLDQPRVVIADIDLTKDFDMIKKEDLDEDLDEEMEEETQEEMDDEEDHNDAGEHLDPKDKVYTPKGSSSKKKPHLCEVCQKAFRDGSDLREHLLIHTGEKPHQCDVCQRRFRLKKGLVEHLRVHTGEKPYSCEVCQRCFSSANTRKRHMLTHTGQKPYSCETCGSRFTQRQQLKTHIRTHTGEKPFSCDVCKKSFSSKWALRDHVRMHTGEKPYECKDCKKKFLRLFHLKRHRISYHS